MSGLSIACARRVRLSLYLERPHIAELALCLLLHRGQYILVRSRFEVPHRKPALNILQCDATTLHAFPAAFHIVASSSVGILRARSQVKRRIFNLPLSSVPFISLKSSLSSSGSTTSVQMSTHSGRR